MATGPRGREHGAEGSQPILLLRWPLGSLWAGRGVYNAESWLDALLHYDSFIENLPNSTKKQLLQVWIQFLGCGGLSL